MSIYPSLKEHYKAILVVLFASLIILNVGVVIKGAVQSNWDPIEDYPTQQVIAPDETVTLVNGTTLTMPVIHFNPKENPELHVKVHAVKCVKEEAGEITIEGTPTFDFTYPDIVTVTSAVTQTKKSGCVDKIYDNLISYTVVNQIADREPGPVIMHYGAAETPIAADGSKGKTKIWRTEDFAIIRE